MDMKNFCFSKIDGSNLLYIIVFESAFSTSKQMLTTRCPVLSSKFAVSNSMLVLFFLLKASFNEWFCHFKVSMYLTSDPKFALFTVFKLPQPILKSMKIRVQNYK